MTKITNDKNGNDPQLAFFFWLGEEGDLESVSEEEFAKKQEDWNGVRP